MTFTKEQLIEKLKHRISVASEFPESEKAQMDLELARIALASLEAEPVCVIDQSNLDYLKSGSDADVWPASRTEMGDVLLYRTAPPAPVSVPEMKPVDLDEGFDEWYSEGESGADSVAPEWFSEAMKPVFLGTWRACRAAMLQGADGNSPAHSGCRPAQNCISPAQCGNSPAIPDGWVMVPEEPTHEMLEAGDEQFGTYDVYRRMIAASPQQK